MALRSRVPKVDGIHPDLERFLDAVDKRQLRAGNIANVPASPTNEELATAINALLEAQRTK